VSSFGVLTSSFGTLAKHLCGLVTTETSTPLTTVVFILIGKVSLSGADKGAQLLLVLALHVLESQDSSSLLVNNCTKTGFALNDDVGDTHLAAESGEEDDELDWVYIVGDDDE